MMRGLLVVQVTILLHWLHHVLRLRWEDVVLKVTSYHIPCSYQTSTICIQNLMWSLPFTVHLKLLASVRTKCSLGSLTFGTFSMGA